MEFLLTRPKTKQPAKRLRPAALVRRAETRLSTKGQIVIPKELRDDLGLSEGDVLTVEVRGNELRLFPTEVTTGIDALEVSGILRPLLSGRAPIPESEWQRRADEALRQSHGRRHR